MVIKKQTSRKSKSGKSRTTRISTVKNRMTKTQVFAHVAEITDLTKRQVTRVFEALADLAQAHLKKGGVGEFVIPGLAKCVVKRKAATKARKGINPFTGEPMTFKAKPARNVVKIRPLKRLKEMVE
ncbi:DNA-binding protein [Coxiella-like endosymbiont of Rhipicephalus sanguineus]|uniref:Viral histone-like protein n=1 Tax=Candidatus Coxiella mudrowiae TaxID=2054173 RepID=A0ABM5UUZ6_9COXI|nr:HU family DNA-binding protein [Candidatus Coxiella mudrowiae]AKQ33820.1 DNA-binding protein BpH2 [Candidatus Coxiella mudrowiae]MBT8506519.1 DNA-binding protein [Coxiella-like endosymbiont of Rhipicephalus sanguineus]